jgi:alanyl-tRNA synthetase
MRNHTATHILHKALQEILGDHVKQAGSLVSPERLRFDFTHFEAISAETLEQVENRVNEEILEALNVHTDVKSYDEAIKTGATALFGEKYGDTVRIVNVGNYSKEFCGGTHIGNSAEIGLFSITSESSVAAGVRRIEAVTGTAALEELHQMKHFEKNVAKALDCDNKSILQKIEKLNTESRELRKELEQMKKENAKGQVANIQNNAKVVNGVSIIKAKINGMSVDEMKGMADELVGNAGSNIAVLLGTASDKANFVLKVSSDLVKKGVHAGKLIKEIAKIAGGNGGGRPDMASAGGKDADKLEEALNAGEEMIGKALA